MAKKDHTAFDLCEFTINLMADGHQIGSMLRAADMMLERVLNKPTPAIPLDVQEDVIAAVHLIWAARAQLEDVVERIDRATTKQAA